MFCPFFRRVFMTAPRRTGTRIGTWCGRAWRRVRCWLGSSARRTPSSRTVKIWMSFREPIVVVVFIGERVVGGVNVVFAKHSCCFLMILYKQRGGEGALIWSIKWLGVWLIRVVELEIFLCTRRLFFFFFPRWMLIKLCTSKNRVVNLLRTRRSVGVSNQTTTNLRY